METRKIQTAYDRWSVEQNLSNLDEVVENAMFHYLRVDLGLPEDVARKRAAAEVDRTAAHRECDDCEKAGLSFRGKRVLELGAGLGAVSVELINRGADLIALEPGSSWRKITAQRIAAAGIGSTVGAVGEQLPFADQSIDLIVSLQVLEHVQNPQSVIRESFRVLKPGGYIYMTYENYLSFWEPHYRVRWLPLLPKTIGAIYLRAKGRDPKFLRESITYTTLLSVRRSFFRAGFQCQREIGFSKSLQSPAKTGMRWRFWKAVASLSNPAALKGIMILDNCRRLIETPITEIMQKPPLDIK